MLFMAKRAGHGRSRRRVQSRVQGRHGHPPEKGVPELSGEGRVQVTPGTQAEMGIPAES